MANLASQLEKITMAHTFLDWTWLQWFKTVGSGVEWLELATVKKECHQLYEQYKGEEWVCLFDVHFAPVDPSLEFLMDDLTAGMMLFEDLRPNDQFFFQHPISVLAVARGEEQSEGHKGEETANCGDIQEAGPLTPKAVAGGITKIGDNSKEQREGKGTRRGG
ncbi:hypothetical protein E4T56_gene11379 [Termitomyces sp. T112]|nr:hypothetical protein E4T56_gene11379 [Termitomyces sp. T112]